MRLLPCLDYTRDKIFATNTAHCLVMVSGSPIISKHFAKTHTLEILTSLKLKLWKTSRSPAVCKTNSTWVYFRYSDFWRPMNSLLSRPTKFWFTINWLRLYPESFPFLKKGLKKVRKLNIKKQIPMTIFPASFTCNQRKRKWTYTWHKK